MGGNLVAGGFDDPTHREFQALFCWIDGGNPSHGSLSGLINVSSLVLLDRWGGTNEGEKDEATIQVSSLVLLDRWGERALPSISRL